VKMGFWKNTSKFWMNTTGKWKNNIKLWTNNNKFWMNITQFWKNPHALLFKDPSLIIFTRCLSEKRV